MNKGPYSQSYDFSSCHVWMWKLDHKKVECWRIDAFVLWCWRRLLRVPWSARWSNQSILREIKPEYSLEGLLLKLSSNTLPNWYKERTHCKRPWCWERFRTGEEGDKVWVGWTPSPTQWRWIWANSGIYWRTGKPGMLPPMGLQRVRHDLVTEKHIYTHLDYYKYSN